MNAYFYKYILSKTPQTLTSSFTNYINNAELVIYLLSNAFYKIYFLWYKLMQVNHEEFLCLNPFFLGELP